MLFGEFEFDEDNDRYQGKVAGSWSFCQPRRGLFQGRLLLLKLWCYGVTDGDIYQNLALAKVLDSLVECEGGIISRSRWRSKKWLL